MVSSPVGLEKESSLERKDTLKWPPNQTEESDAHDSAKQWSDDIKPSSSLLFLVFSIAVAVYFQCYYVAAPLTNHDTTTVDPKDLTSAPTDFKTTSRPTARETAIPSHPACFTVHFNGDGFGHGISVCSTDFKRLNEVIQTTCVLLPEVYHIANFDNDTLTEICDPDNGARLYVENGERLWSLVDVHDGARTHIVPQGIQFVFPVKEAGNTIFPHVPSPSGEPIKMVQLSSSPVVFELENFITDKEIDAIIDCNKQLVKPSEVGFSGWRDDTRTSSTSWDFNSWASKRVRRRSFDLAGIPFDDELADAVQVLRYNHKEWYKPHTDYFDEKGYDGHDPRVNNGTNRFATIFVYLSDVEEGGNTVFPLSTSHEGYNGEQIVHPGTVKTPGYIADSDAAWACNASSTALRSRTKRGGAILFYSQRPDGSLDPYSLHGGCPVIKGTKWSANVWLWNRPKPSNARAKDHKPSVSEDVIQLRFHNKLSRTVNLFWDDGSDEMVFQTEILPGHFSPMSTYNGHVFVMKDAATNVTVSRFIARDDLHKGRNFVVEIKS